MDLKHFKERYEEIISGTPIEKQLTMSDIEMAKIFTMLVVFEEVMVKVMMDLEERFNEIR